MVVTVLVLIFLLLIIRSVVAECQYYQSVKEHEPKLWQKLGAPKSIGIPIAFSSSKGSALLNDITSEVAQKLAAKHRVAGAQLFSYLGLVLVVSIVYFNIA